MYQKSLYLYVSMKGICLNAESQVPDLRKSPDAFAPLRDFLARPVPLAPSPPLVSPSSLMHSARRGHGSSPERSRVADRRARPIG